MYKYYFPISKVQKPTDIRLCEVYRCNIASISLGCAAAMQANPSLN